MHGTGICGTRMQDIWSAIATGFESKAGTWIVSLVLIAAAFGLAGAVFLVEILTHLVHSLVRVTTDVAVYGEREIHSVFHLIELHVLGLAAAMVGIWSWLTAGLSLIDGPYRLWLTRPVAGVLACGVELLGVLVWVIVGLMAWRIAIGLVLRAYKRSAYA